MSRDIFLKSYRVDESTLNTWRYLKACWQYQGVVWLFAERDLRIKYAQAWRGISWTLLQHFSTIALYTLFFSHLFKQFSGKDYFLLVCSGVLCWSLFSYIATQTGTVLQKQQSAVQKLLFPKLLLLISKVYVGLLDFFCMLFVCLFIFTYLDYLPSWRYMSIVVLIFMLVTQGLCVGLWLSTLSIYHTHLQNILPLIMHALLWLSPIFYTPHLLQAPLSILIHLNPLTESIALCRWMIFGVPFDYVPYMGVRSAAVILLLLWGVQRLKNTEKRLLDEL